VTSREAVVDYELAYVERRAAEELTAAKAATSPQARQKHRALAKAFEEHIKRLGSCGER
jgi:hypothetical protein